MAPPGWGRARQSSPAAVSAPDARGPGAVWGWRGGGQRRPTRRGWGTALSGVEGSRPGKGRTPGRTGLQGGTAPPGGRRDPAGEGAPAARRWGQCQGRQVHAAHCSASRWPPPPPAPATPRPGGCQRRCHGRLLFAGARGRAAATDGAGRGGGGGPPPPGRPPSAAPSAPQPAPSAHASPPRASPAAKFGSTSRRPLTPCPFHPTPDQVLGGRGEPGGGRSAAPEPGAAAAGGDSDSGGGTRGAREWAPTGTPRAAGARRSPAGSRGSALAPEGARASALERKLLFH